jgi:hypothetical protein
MQKITQCGTAIRSTMTVTIQDQQVSLCQINCRQGAGELPPPLRHRLRIARAGRGPFYEGLFMLATRKHFDAGLSKS